MNPANLQFSPEESALLQEPAWILMKNGILAKIDAFLGALGNDLQVQLNREFPEPMRELLQLPPKLSRGEHYQGLPYRMMDFPRWFTRESIYAWRTMFWWGHFLSVTVHLSGPHQTTYAPPIIRRLCACPELSFHVAMEGEEWNHDLRSAPLIGSREPRYWIEQSQRAPFCKFSRIIPIEPTAHLDAELRRCYQIFSESVREAQLPRR